MSGHFIYRWPNQLTYGIAKAMRVLQIQQRIVTSQLSLIISSLFYFSRLTKPKQCHWLWLSARGHTSQMLISTKWIRAEVNKWLVKKNGLKAKRHIFLLLRWLEKPSQKSQWKLCWNLISGQKALSGDANVAVFLPKKFK